VIPKLYRTVFRGIGMVSDILIVVSEIARNGVR